LKIKWWTRGWVKGFLTKFTNYDKIQRKDEVMTMNEKLDLFTIKKTMESYVGGKIKIRTNKGRKKSLIKDGVLESIHPSIFVVKLEDEHETQRRVSFMYADVLTKAVEIFSCKEKLMI
jgi:uncharacterized protein Veg